MAPCMFIDAEPEVTPSNSTSKAKSSGRHFQPIFPKTDYDPMGMSSTDLFLVLLLL